MVHIITFLVFGVVAVCTACGKNSVFLMVTVVLAPIAALLLLLALCLTARLEKTRSSDQCFYPKGENSTKDSKSGKASTTGGRTGGKDVVAKRGRLKNVPRYLMFVWLSYPLQQFFLLALQFLVFELGKVCWSTITADNWSSCFADNC